MYAHICIYIYIYIHIDLHVCVCACVCLCACVYIYRCWGHFGVMGGAWWCVCVCVYVCIYIHIYIYVGAGALFEPWEERGGICPECHAAGVYRMCYL
jgi:hypothetical protein